MEGYAIWILVYILGVLIVAFIGGFLLPPNAYPGFGMFIVSIFWPIIVPIFISITAGQSIRAWISIRGRR